MSNYTLTDELSSMYICVDAGWLAESYQSLTGFALIQQLSSFYAKLDNASTPTAIAAAAEFMGTSVEHVEEMYAYYGDGDAFAQTVELAQQVLPTLGHPASDSGRFIGVFVFLSVLSVLAIGLRMYSRSSIGGYIRSYDWLLVFGALLAFGSSLMKAIRELSTFQWHYI